MPRAPRESSRARFYHDIQLKGPIPQRLIFHPAITASPSSSLIEAALEWGQAEDPSPQNPARADAFHRFDWLPILAGAGNGGQVAIRPLIKFWLEYHGRFSPTPWRASICATRLIRMLCYFDHLSHGMDGPLRLQLLDSIARQARHIAKFLRKGRGEQRRSIEIARTLASLCLPEDRLIGAPDASRLGLLLRPIANGELPRRWRNMNTALEDADHLILLAEAFRQRRLSAPPELDEAIKVARLYLGGFLTPEGGLVQLPGQHAPDSAALSRLGPVIRPEANHFLSQMGYQSLRSGSALLMFDMGLTDHLTNTGAIALTVGKSPLIINCGQPSQTAIALVDRLTAWADALSSPAAASGFDIAALSKAECETEAKDLHLRYPTRRGEISRHFRLEPSANQLRAEEILPTKNLNLRLHIDAEAVINNEGEAISLVFETDRNARLLLEGATAEIEESVSAWQDGDIQKMYQIVISPCASAIRWRINWT